VSGLSRSGKVSPLSFAVKMGIGFTPDIVKLAVGTAG